MQSPRAHVALLHVSLRTCEQGGTRKKAEADLFRRAWQREGIPSTVLVAASHIRRIAPPFVIHHDLEEQALDIMEEGLTRLERTSQEQGEGTQNDKGCDVR